MKNQDQTSTIKNQPKWQGEKWELPERKARVEALKHLFSHEFHSPKPPALSDKDYPARFVSDKDCSSFLPDEQEDIMSLNLSVLEYSKQLVTGVRDNKKMIDDLIKQSSEAWDIKRMALVDLNIIRIAVFEMHFLKKPLSFKVCIDEAIEVAKVYGSSDSSSYINGVLDHISQIDLQKTFHSKKM